VACRFINGNVGANRGGQTLLDYNDFPRPGFIGAFFHRPALNFGYAGWDAYHHPGFYKPVTGQDTGNKITDHFFSGLKVGNNAVPQRPDGADVPRCFAEHTLRVRSHRDNFFCSQFDRHYGRFIQHNALVPNINNGVTGP